jgi:hypothetical protein
LHADEQWESVLKRDKNGASPLKESARTALGVKEAIVRNRQAKRLFWLAVKAALWGALTRLVSKLIDRFMS